MTSTTVYGSSNNGSGTGSGWSNTSNANGSNSGTYALWTSGSSSTSTNLAENMSSLSGVPSGEDIDSVTLYIYSRQMNSGNATIWYSFSYNGSAYCSGHSDTITSTGGLDSAVCSHFSYTTSGIRTGSHKLRVYATGLDYSIVYGFQVAYFRITVNSSSATAPSAPADPSITADGVGDLTVSSNSPSDGGATLDNVEHQISTSSTFASGNSTWTKGSAPSNPQTHQFTGEGNGQLHYARARYHNSVGWGAYNSSPYNSATTWDVASAPTWAGTKFTARTTSSITFDWVTPGDDGGTAITEYWYDWKIDGGGYATIDTNSTNTIATKPSLSAGTKYWFKVLARNLVGSSPFTSEEFHWTLCATPSAPTVTANAVGSLRIQHSDITGIDKWRVMRASTSGGGYTQVYLSGAGATALDWSNTGLNDGETWYYKLYARNIDGNDSALGAFASGTTWDVPDAPTFPTLGEANALITVTKPSNPADNGGPLTLWQWQADNNQDFLNPASLQATSSDIAVGTPTNNHNVGNTHAWFYRVRFKNAVGPGPWGTVTADLYNAHRIYSKHTSSSNAYVVSATALGTLNVTRPNIPSVGGSLVPDRFRALTFPNYDSLTDLSTVLEIADATTHPLRDRLANGTYANASVTVNTSATLATAGGYDMTIVDKYVWAATAELDKVRSWADAGIVLIVTGNDTVTNDMWTYGTISVDDDGDILSNLTHITSATVFIAGSTDVNYWITGFKTNVSRSLAQVIRVVSHQTDSSKTMGYLYLPGNIEGGAIYFDQYGTGPNSSSNDTFFKDIVNFLMARKEALTGTTTGWTVGGSINITTLSNGTRYRTFVQWQDNGVANGAVSDMNYITWTICATPTISSVVANAVGQLRVSWSTVTGVDHWELEKSTTGTGGWSTVDLNIPAGTLLKDVPSLGNGALWYFRLRATNADGVDSANSANGSGTTWDLPTVPQTFDVVSI